MTTNSAELKRELLDEDGENRAVRSFLMLYSCNHATTVKQMRDHLTFSGFDGCWPKWTDDEITSDITKAGAQDWLRHLFALEGSAEQVSEREALLHELDWCIAEGHSGPRSHKALIAARAALSAPERNVMTGEPVLDFEEIEQLFMVVGKTPINFARAVEEAVLKKVAAFNQQGEQTAPEWHAMSYAPTDGTEIELLLHHPNHQYASDSEKEQWTAIVKAKWIGFNGGGWTWSGMFGSPMGWRPIAAAPSTAQKE